MKKNKFILSALLVGYLVTTSCTETRDSGKDIVYSFSADFLCPKEIIAGKRSLLNIKLVSDVYLDDHIKYECFFEDSKNSFLLSSKGDTIRSGKIFQIPNINKNILLDFYSDDLGEHNLRFTFKNSREFTVTKEQKLLVEKVPFTFEVKRSFENIMIGTPLELVYLLESYDQLKHSYKLKFEIEGSHNATLYGNEQGKWFNISELSGKLSYVPLTPGIHKVKITAKNEARIEKIADFTITSVGMGNPTIKSFSVDKLIVSNFYKMREGAIILDYRTSKFDWTLDAYSGNDKPFVKGTVRIGSLRIEQSFEINSNENQDIHYECRLPSQKLCCYIKKDTEVMYEITLENSDGVSAVTYGYITPLIENSYR